MQQQKEPSSIYYKLGRRAGYWYAANQHRVVRNLVVGIVRNFPGGNALLRLFR